MFVEFGNPAEKVERECIACSALIGQGKNYWFSCLFRFNHVGQDPVPMEERREIVLMSPLVRRPAFLVGPSALPLGMELTRNSALVPLGRFANCQCQLGYERIFGTCGDT